MRYFSSLTFNEGHARGYAARHVLRDELRWTLRERRLRDGRFSVFPGAVAGWGRSGVDTEVECERPKKDLCEPKRSTPGDVGADVDLRSSPSHPQPSSRSSDSSIGPSRSSCDGRPAGIAYDGRNFVR